MVFFVFIAIFELYVPTFVVVDIFLMYVGSFMHAVHIETFQCGNTYVIFECCLNFHWSDVVKRFVHTYIHIIAGSSVVEKETQRVRPGLRYARNSLDTLNTRTSQPVLRWGNRRAYITRTQTPICSFVARGVKIFAESGTMPMLCERETLHEHLERLNFWKACIICMYVCVYVPGLRVVRCVYVSTGRLVSDNTMHLHWSVTYSIRM